MPDSPALGRHLIMEMWECSDAINNAAAVRAAMIAAATSVGATVVNVNVHQFAPQGITGFALLSESHLAIHSWPECNYVAADLFTCGLASDLTSAAEVLKDHFRPRRMQMQTIARGRSVPSCIALAAAEANGNRH